MKELTPQRIVKELDKHIIGQDAAKRAAAIAIRNRWRRRQLPEEIRDEVGPSNIILIGRTGIGKTEIARRLAGLVNAPFIKVEATKYTEVGYHGRDVESMIRDLVDLAVHLVRDEQTHVVRAEAERLTEEQLLDTLIPATESAPATDHAASDIADRRHRSREKLRAQLSGGDLDDRIVEVTVESKAPAAGIMATLGGDQLDPGTQNFLEAIMPTKSKRRSIPIREARKIIFDQQCDKLIDHDKVTEMALKRTENGGIIFLDELDKLATPTKTHGPDVSRQGVQRDLLPIIEGCTVTTRYGPVKTDHILFIAAGAFHDCKPSDLMPELQGRLPIRVSLDDLTEQDFVRILTEPKNALTKQQVALLATEGLLIEFTDDAVSAMAAIAFQVNQTMGNIGARRLVTVMERVMEEISFNASERTGLPESVTSPGSDTMRIDESYVRERLTELCRDTDLSRFIL